MINISEEIKSLIESFGVKKSLVIRLGDLDITSDLISQDSVNISQGLSSKDNYSIGNTICSELNFAIINNKNKYTESSFYNKEVSVQMLIENEAGTELRMNCGKYICQRPTITNTGKIDIRAYDFMMKFEINSDRFLNTLTYPITLKEFIGKACEYVGIEHNLTNDIANATFEIKNRPESQKFTLRNIMSMAIAMTGGNGRINLESNKFEIVYLEDTNYTIPDSVHLNSIEIQDYQIAKIECIVVSNKENKDIIYGNRESYVYYMDNNELIYSNTDEEIVNMLGQILPRLENIDYKPFSITIGRGLIFLQPGDIISYVFNGKTYKAPILDRTLEGVYLADNLEASGSEDRDKLRSDSISSGQVSGIASAGYDNYNLTSTKRYMNETGTNIIAMGMYHSNIDKELIFKPSIFGNEYLGMETNFQEIISNTELFGEEPDMTRIDK